MSRPNFDRLAPPPRTRPTALRIQALVGSRLALAGWILLAFSSPFVWAFVLRTDLLSPVLFRADVDKVTGRVTSARATGLRDERQEAVLFDPRDPRHAVLVDELPAGVSADLEGQFTTPPNAGLVIAVPLLTALGNVACAASRLLR